MDRSVCSSRDGASREPVPAARLEREFPALAARIQTGELSVYHASIEAGLRKPPARNLAQPEAYQLKEQKPAPKKTASRASTL